MSEKDIKKEPSEQEMVEKMLDYHDKKHAKYNASLRRTASEVKAYRQNSKALEAIALALLILITIIFVVVLMYTRYSSFTVSVNKFNNQKYSLEISDRADFAAPTNKLECPSVADITNIDGNSIDMEKAGSVDGEANGANYLCYTYYLRNNGEVGVNINYNITISNVERNLDEACRVRVIYSRDESDRVVTTYAKAASVDQTTHVTIPEPDTVPFKDRYVVCEEQISKLLPGEVCKFTVIIWLEGPDPQCTDDKIGGLFETDMNFEVVGVDE